MELQEKKELGLKMYLKGNSLSSISKEIRINRLTLTKYIKSQGVGVTNPARKYKYNDDFFENIDTEEKAYWLGFIYADGCINDRGKQKTLEITLQESDRSHLVKFINSIGGVADLITSKLVKLNYKEIPSSRVAINCTKMCEDLIRHGATPRKSLTLTFPKSLKPYLLRHFIRGYIDGDGTITYPRLRISVLGTMEFLIELQNYFEVIGATKTKLTRKRDNKAYSFEKGGSEVSLILYNLYSNSTIYLDRKYEKAIAHLTQQLQESKE